MPQNENLSEAWRTSLGDNWREVRDTWLHTLGNLTLTGYNVEYSDRPFAEKRDMTGGFRESPLRVNAGLRELDTWDEDAIRIRADNLANKAVDMWTGPSLSAGVLEAYQATEQKQPKAYSIEDHIHLGERSHTRKLFEEFRNEVLALDPCVSEEFLKLYVAYKAETNFVDVVPQAAQLRLSLNMRFHELHDPRGLATDITHVGRWGNGDVETRIRTSQDLPYALGLVRQALEKQMGNGETES